MGEGSEPHLPRKAIRALATTSSAKPSDKTLGWLNEIPYWGILRLFPLFGQQIFTKHLPPISCRLLWFWKPPGRAWWTRFHGRAVYDARLGFREHLAQSPPQDEAQMVTPRGQRSCPPVGRSSLRVQLVMCEPPRTPKTGISCRTRPSCHANTFLQLSLPPPCLQPKRGKVAGQVPDLKY